MSENNSFSVVIATKGRVDLLADLLTSLKTAREGYPGKTEVLLIDDSASADAEKIQAISLFHHANYRYFSGNVAAKRNYGANEAKHEILLFLDSDCLVKPSLFQAYNAAYKKNSVCAVAGPLQFVGEDTWFWKAIAATPFVIGFYLPNWLEKLEWGVTANFTVRRWLFEKISGFDEALFQKAGEDVDLGLRIRKAGFEIHSCQQASISHSKKTWTPPKDMIRRVWNYGAADYWLISKHPEKAVMIPPRRTLIYGFWLLLGIAITLITSNPFMLWIYPVIILLENSLLSLWINATVPRKKASFFQQLTAQLLIHVNEAGYLMECLKKRDFIKMNKQMVYYQGQYKGMLEIHAAIFRIVLLLTTAMGIIGIFYV